MEKFNKFIHMFFIEPDCAIKSYRITTKKEQHLQIVYVTDYSINSDLSRDVLSRYIYTKCSYHLENY